MVTGRLERQTACSGMIVRDEGLENTKKLLNIEAFSQESIETIVGTLHEAVVHLPEVTGTLCRHRKRHKKMAQYGRNNFSS